MRYIVKFIFLLNLMILTGCYEHSKDSIVATVNGKPIPLSLVQGLQDTEFADFNGSTEPSVAKIKQEYGNTLSTIIIYEIIIQHLEKTNNMISEADLDAYEKSLRADYPEGEFEKFITENAINIESWRTLLRYQLVMEAFKNNILRKNYAPHLEDVHSYYAQNEKNFILPKSLTLHAVLHEDKAALESFYTLPTLLAKKDELWQYSIDINENDIPEDIRKEVLSLKKDECTKVFKQGDAFSRLCLDGINPSKKLTISEAYPYIEAQLLELEWDSLFQTWLTENINDNKVEVSTHLIKNIK